MGRIYKRKNIWYLDICAKGRRIRKKVGPSKRIAELALKDAEVKIAREEFGFTNNDITVERLIELFRVKARKKSLPLTSLITKMRFRRHSSLTMTVLFSPKQPTRISFMTLSE